MPVERLHTEHSRGPARHVGAPAAEGDVLRARVGNLHGTRNRELPRVPGGHPESPVGSEPDVVRSESRRERGHVSKPAGVDHGDVLRRGAESDPELPAGRVDRDVARPAWQGGPSEHASTFDVDRNDAASTRVGDECVPSVGMSRGVTRLLEPTQDMPDAVTVDDRDGADGGVADDGSRPTSSIARGSGSVAMCRTTPNEPRSTTASRDSASHVTSAADVDAINAGRSVSGAPAASTTNSRRFTTSLRRDNRRGPVG